MAQLQREHRHGGKQRDGGGQTDRQGAAQRPEDAGRALDIQRDLGDLESWLAGCFPPQRPSRALVGKLVTERERDDQHLATSCCAGFEESLRPVGDDRLEHRLRQRQVAGSADRRQWPAGLIHDPYPGNLVGALPSGRFDDP